MCQIIEPDVLYVHDQVGVCSTELFHLREIKHTESFLKDTTLMFELLVHLWNKLCFFQLILAEEDQFHSLNLTFFCPTF